MTLSLAFRMGISPFVFWVRDHQTGSFDFGSVLILHHGIYPHKSCYCVAF